MITDNCAPRTRKRKLWYQKRRSRRNVKRWILQPGKQVRRKIPIWLPFTRKRGLKSWQRPFMAFTVFITFLAKLILWIMRMLDKKKPKKPSVPIPFPKPNPGSPYGGGGKGNSSGPSTKRTCADDCGCLACDERCRPWYCAGKCADDAEGYGQLCRCPDTAIWLEEDKPKKRRHSYR